MCVVGRRGKDQDPPRGRAARGARGGLSLHPEHHGSVRPSPPYSVTRSSTPTLVEHLSWPDRVVFWAAYTVITSSLGHVWARDDRILEGDPAAIDRLMQGAGFAQNLSELPQLAFVDRKGWEVWVRSQEPKRSARAFAAAEVATPSPWRSKTKKPNGNTADTDQATDTSTTSSVSTLQHSQSAAHLGRLRLRRPRRSGEEINRLRNLLYSAALVPSQRSGQEREGRQARAHPQRQVGGRVPDVRPNCSCEGSAAGVLARPNDTPEERQQRLRGRSPAEFSAIRQAHSRAIWYVRRRSARARHLVSIE